MKLGRFLKHFALAAVVASVIVIGEGAATAQPPKVIQIYAVASPYGDYGQCDQGPANVMTGTLDGCWYTDSGDLILAQDNLDGTSTWSFAGVEHFVGCVHVDANPTRGCGPRDLYGSWQTTFVFNEIVDNNNNFAEISGGCDHPIFQKSGTGDFEGVNGNIFMTDNVQDFTANVTGWVSLTRSSHQPSANAAAAPAASASPARVHC